MGDIIAIKKLTKLAWMDFTWWTAIVLTESKSITRLSSKNNTNSSTTILQLVGSQWSMFTFTACVTGKHHAGLTLSISSAWTSHKNGLSNQPASWACAAGTDFPRGPPREINLEGFRKRSVCRAKLWKKYIHKLIWDASVDESPPCVQDKSQTLLL